MANKTDNAKPKNSINTVPAKKTTAATTNPQLEFIPDEIKAIINQDNDVDVKVAYRLLDYIDKMSGKVQSDDVIMEQQVHLFHTFTNILESERDDYVRRQEVALKIIAQDLASEKSAFGGTKPYRIDKVMNLCNTKHLTIWLTFYRQVAKPQTRATVLANTNIKEVAKTIYRNESRNAFLAYYGAQMQY